MKNYKILTLLCIATIFLSNCSSVKEGFTSNRKNNSDEFLVKKKAPLVMPPEFGELPNPNPKIKKDENPSNQNDLEKLIKQNKNNSNDIKNSNATSLEKLILKKIKKNNAN
jgi:hypothetical protein